MEKPLKREAFPRLMPGKVWRCCIEQISIANIAVAAQVHARFTDRPPPLDNCEPARRGQPVNPRLRRLSDSAFADRHLVTRRIRSVHAVTFVDDQADLS